MPVYHVFPAGGLSLYAAAEHDDLKVAKRLCRQVAAESASQFAVVIDARNGTVVYHYQTRRKPDAE
jgi:hypothetical protein